MKVDPGEVVRLKVKLEAVRDSVNQFVVDNREALLGAPFADDDVSKDAAGDFAHNATIAVDVTRQFIGQLNVTINSLQAAANTYHLVDDTNSIALQQLNRGA